MNSASISMPGSLVRLASVIPSTASSVHSERSPRTVCHSQIPSMSAKSLTGSPTRSQSSPRSNKDGADFGRGVSVRRKVGGSQRGEQLELAGAPLGSFVEGLEQCTTPGQVADGFGLSRALARLQPGLEPVADRFLGHTRLGEVMGDQFWAGEDGLRKSCLKGLRGPPMELLSPALDQRVVQGIFEQRVLEDIARPGRPAFLVENLRLHQLCQLCLERRLVQFRDGAHQLKAELTAKRGGELGHLALAFHAVESRKHQVLERGGNLAGQQALGLRAGFARQMAYAGLLHHFRELFDEKRYAACAIEDLIDDVVRQRTARHLFYQVDSLAAGQTIQSQAGVVGARGPGDLELRSKREQGQNRIVQALGEEVPQELERGRVSPVQVFDDEEHRRPGGPDAQPLEQGPERFFPLAGWRQRRRWKAVRGRKR